MSSRAKRPAIFIDRDGTLIADKDYLHKPEEVQFIEGAIAAIETRHQCRIRNRHGHQSIRRRPRLFHPR